MKKILVLSDPASIHANRFILLLQQAGYDVRLFPADNIYYLEEHLENIKIYSPPIAIIPSGSIRYISTNGRKISKFRTLIIKYLNSIKIVNFLFYKNKNRRTKQLTKVIKFWNPNLIISQKLQNDGYLASSAKSNFLKRNLKFPAWLHFCWGTDIEFFGKNPLYADLHLPMITSALAKCDYFLADSQRDVLQAKSYGFNGKNLGFMLAPGGFIKSVIELRDLTPSKSRKIILIKGREGGLVGRAKNIIEALKIIAPHLAGYDIRFIMVTQEARVHIRDLSEKYNLNCQILDRTSYSKLIELFCESLLAISASDIDGTPGFLLESIAFGAFPIHSRMSSINEWIVHGKNGLTFDVNNINEISECILYALSNQKMLDTAFEINRVLAIQKISREKISTELTNILSNIL